MEGIREIKSERYVAGIIALAAGVFLLLYTFSSVARTNYRAGWDARNGDIQNIHRVEVDLLLGEIADLSLFLKIFTESPHLLSDSYIVVIFVIIHNR